MDSANVTKLSYNSPVTASSSSHDNEDIDFKLATSLALEEEANDRDCASDAALALVLQMQFDVDYNSQLKRQEARMNGQSKVGVSLAKFQRNPSCNSALSEYQDDFLEPISGYSTEFQGHEHSPPVWDVFEESEIKQRSRMMGRSGFVLDEDGKIITKHDIPTSSRKNMCRLMELKTDIQTGDAGAIKDDFKLNNYVYNKLKTHSKKSSRRTSQKLFDKKERESTGILEDIQSCRMSDATRAIMDGLLVAYKIEKLNGVIGHGKESTVLHATGKNHEDLCGQEVAIKIFNTKTNVAFKTRDTYNKSKCPSYKFDKPKSKNDSLNKWAERGFKNLKLLRKADINCPDAISLKKHVLVMTFLGNDASPSPQLKNAHLDLEDLRSSYEQVVDIMCRMYRDCELIHGDLSEYNLLWHNNQVFVIDVSQSMFTSHPNANMFLLRDCRNILNFYERSGLTDILDLKSLFQLVCGKELTDLDVELLTKTEDFPCNEKLMQKEDRAEEVFGKTDGFEAILNSKGNSKGLPNDKIQILCQYAAE